jgi:hypothetical protein
MMIQYLVLINGEVVENVTVRRAVHKGREIKHQYKALVRDGHGEELEVDIEHKREEHCGILLNKIMTRVNGGRLWEL